MKKSELFENIDTLMTEVLDLKKSWDGKMEKAEEEKPSDAQDDAVHMADHGADEETLADYAKKLSDEELHELISSLVQEAEGRGGESEETQTSEEEPEMEKAEEEQEAPESEEESQEPEEMEEGSESDEHEEAEGSLDEKVAELSDEEIQTLMSAIQAEMSKRGSGDDSEESMEKASKEGVEWHNEGKGGLPTYEEWKRLKTAEKKDKSKASSSSATVEKSDSSSKIDWKKVKADPKAPGAEKEKEHEEWLKQKKEKPDEKMEKSLQAALKKIDELSSQVDEFRKSQARRVEYKESMPTQKYADPKITVLEKSSTDDSKIVMTGATLANWLISEQAAGNRKVNSDLVTKANLSKSVEDASEFYKELERIGIKAPRS